MLESIKNLLISLLKGFRFVVILAIFGFMFTHLYYKKVLGIPSGEVTIQRVSEESAKKVEQLGESSKE